MVLLAVVSVPISLINIQNKFAVLSLISGSNNIKVLPSNQLQTQVMFYLNQYESGISIASIFWGLWLFPFGYLVFKSAFLPKIFGVLLILGCFGYLINFLGRFLIPNYAKAGIASYISLPSRLGEIGICLWLLVVGAKNKQNTF